MNIRIWLCILLIIIVSCKSDNFYDTKRELSTNKTIYNIGDEIIIRMKITPQKIRKEILVYKNYKNIDFSFSIINHHKNIYNGYWSNTSGTNLPLSDIKELTITKNDPFIVEYIGNIGVENENVYILFPKLNNYKVTFNKEILQDANTFIRIHGISYPIKPEIGASLEEYFNTKDFKIKL
ncbi:phage tail protein [Chryseobacterium sp. WG14]|uniref:phage tail protein n=1 Tax=Chryseobacterium sp. WG14 TaxID=2926909 RepID=UPI00211E9E36|nr:phage tail protein [Chryseobacterium sp. WG14]MCQ9639360.1 phage tail protein [Chryseobacterium sp. WG14]